jgi:hypothetical protein
MEFVKKHYEKIILCAVLLGVVGFLVFLPFVISHDQAQQADMALTITKPKVAPLPPLNSAQWESASGRLVTPPNYDFSTTNKLFNPVEWKKALNGDLIKVKTGNEIVEGIIVTKIMPLYFAVTLDQVTTNELGARYAIGVERQAAPNPAQRRKMQRFASVGEKKDVFTLVSVKGAPENPSELILKLSDSGDTISISKEKPFQRVDAYSADLKYDPERKTFPGRRIGSVISVGGQDYIVVAIDVDEVILSAQSNQKRTTLKYTP